MDINTHKIEEQDPYIWKHLFKVFTKQEVIEARNGNESRSFSNKALLIRDYAVMSSEAERAWKRSRTELTRRQSASSSIRSFLFGRSRSINSNERCAVIAGINEYVKSTGYQPLTPVGTQLTPMPTSNGNEAKLSSAQMRVITAVMHCNWEVVFELGYKEWEKNAT